MIFHKSRKEHLRCAFDALRQVLLQTKRYQKEWSTEQKRGCFANTSLSTATCRIANSMRYIWFQLGMLHIPNLTKAQGQCHSIFCFAMSECENGSWSWDWSKSMKFRKIVKKTRVQFRNARHSVSRFADASISDGLRRILVQFNPSSFIWCQIWHYFYLFWTALTKTCLLQAHLDTLTESVPHFRLSLGARPSIWKVLCTIHGKLTVNRTEAFSPRYWREQFYDHLSEMSSEAIKPAHAGDRKSVV